MRPSAGFLMESRGGMGREESEYSRAGIPRELSPKSVTNTG